MTKNKIIIVLIISVLICGCIYLFIDKKNNHSNNNSNRNSSSIINSNSSDNSNSDNNSVINSNSNDNSTDDNNNNSNSQYNNDKSNITSNSNNNSNSNNSTSNKSNNNNNTNTNDNYLNTDNSFSGVYQSDTHIAHILQINNKAHFYIYNRKTKSTVTIHGSVSGKTLTADKYNISFILKEKGIDFTNTNDKLGKGFIPKIKQYTKKDYFEEFMHGNINGIRGIYTNKYGTIKIYQVYDSQLRMNATVLKKNANTDTERKKYISGSTILNWNKTKNIYASEQYGEDCNTKSPCEWISIKINNNTITVESDSSTINSVFFHIGKYFDENKNKTEPNVNIYTKTSDYSIEQIVNNVF